ncbi:MAG: carboxymuconolactone decarboxylase family protein [Mucilaginibacter polytrichastri]|nr:carboxymuconolactone decarboxylase family protein [Mucilaginibacter polytrichastri]
MNETTELVGEILENTGIEKDYRTDALRLLEKGESRYLRDFKLNLSSTLTSEHLSEKECALIGLSVAINNISKTLTGFFEQKAEEAGATAAEIAEAAGCASLLASNNIFYRFRHFTQKEKYGQIPARIRMQLMMKPVTGKEFFELMSLAISAVNGCEMCVNAHEDSLIKLGTTEERIFDAVRIASLVTASGKVLN